MRLRPAVIVALLTLAGCGSSTTTTTPAATGAASSSTVASTGTGASTAPTTTGATTTPQGTPACVAASLRLSFLGQQGATGHGLLGFGLRNRSSSSCHTFGFPGIQFLDKAGRP